MCIYILYNIYMYNNIITQLYIGLYIYICIDGAVYIYSCTYIYIYIMYTHTRYNTPALDSALAINGVGTFIIVIIIPRWIDYIVLVTNAADMLVRSSVALTAIVACHILNNGRHR